MGMVRLVFCAVIIFSAWLFAPLSVYGNPDYIHIAAFMDEANRALQKGDFDRSRRILAIMKDAGSVDAAVMTEMFDLATETDKAKVADAVSSLEYYAQRGNFDAQIILAKAYYHGSKIPVDYKKAGKYFTQRSVLVEPSNYLGDMYYNGLGFEKSTVNAAYFFAQPLIWQMGFTDNIDHYLTRIVADENIVPRAEKGDPEAQVVLGLLIQAGAAGFERDVELSMEWFDKAASAGQPVAQLQLGDYLCSKKVESDYAKARKLLKASSESGFHPAKARLGKLIHKGWCGFDADPEAGINLLLKAVAQNNNEAANSLYFIAVEIEGSGKPVPEELKRFLRISESRKYEFPVRVTDESLVNSLKKHADVDDPFIVELLAMALLYGEGTGVDVKQAYKYLCRLKELGAQSDELDLVISLILLTGPEEVRNPEKALFEIHKAAENNNFEAMTLLGKLHFSGDHVEKNEDKAFELWEKAAANSNVTAKAILQQYKMSEREKLAVLRKRFLDFTTYRSFAEER